MAPCPRRLGGRILRRTDVAGRERGGNFPSAIKAVTLWFPRRERPSPRPSSNAGANVGAIIAPAAFRPSPSTLAWRWAFIFAGLAASSGSASGSRSTRPGAYKRRISAAELAHIGSDAERRISRCQAHGWLRALRHRQPGRSIVAKFMTDPIGGSLIWLPDYFNRRAA